MIDAEIRRGADELTQKATAARAAARKLALLDGNVKNAALSAIAAALQSRADEIIAANRRDVDRAESAGASAATVDRLRLDEKRLAGIASDTLQVAALPDPVGEVIEMRTLPNGLTVGRIRVPFGVIGVVYEARPNVTVDVAALCLKAGSAVVLRGGSDALESNLTVVRVLGDALESAGAPRDAIQILESRDHAQVDQLLKAKGLIDLLIPRGGKQLIDRVVANATVPVIETGAAVCHTYVDASADLDMALNIVVNAKTRRFSICNALDTLLVHRSVAPAFLPRIGPELTDRGVELRADEASRALLGSGPNVVPAQPADFGTEFLALILAVRVVDSLDEALDHIATYGNGHSEAIVTQDFTAAQRFQREVDAAAVYVNASTQFTDGAQFGLGAEVGISTQKLHARGPMGLREMTTYKWIVTGDGHVRPL
ncbi:MAG: glutamate-5-semialdehyde dehydrogenase [Chloroflexi bacterium]|nr:glutamate-5-semialdehyde dehydrogenase [Chloroflexota bacterium]